MQSLEVSENRFENIEGLNDIEEIENSVSAKRKKKLETKAAKKASRGKTKGGLLSKMIGTKASRKVVRGKLKDAVVYAPLIPLRPVMIAVLSKRGVKAGKNTKTEDLANLFYENVLRKENKNLDHIDINELDEDYAVVAITVIVDAIISFVKGIKDKKKAGEKLNKTEEVIATGTEIAEKRIEDSAKEEAASTVGNKLLFDKKTQMIIIAVVIVIIAGVIYFTKHHKS